MLKRITNIATQISNTISDFKPQIAIVIGSGLSTIVDSVDVKYRISYSNIDGFPLSTVEGHKGELIFGVVEGKNVVVMSGRFHYYEGYSAQDVVLGIRLFKFLGVDAVLLSNAAGAVNCDYNVGDIMVIKDHINFIPNPLIGANEPAFGERFPSMFDCYSSRLRGVAKESGVVFREGVYMAVTGPSYETAAEINAYRILGADAIGMSTAPEVVAAKHSGLEVFAASLITNVTGGDANPTHNEVVEAGKMGAAKMVMLFKEVIKRF